MNLSAIPPFLIYFILAWSFGWKGFALWAASKNNQKNWFIAIFATILVVNTLGILEIIYLFRFASKKLTLNDLKFWKSKS